MIYYLKKLPLFLKTIKIDSENKEKIDLDFNFLNQNSFEIFLKENLLKFLPLYVFDNYNSDWSKIKRLNLPLKIKKFF